MKLVCCENHHYYDAEIHDVCPYCGVDLNTMGAIVTVDRENTIRDNQKKRRKTKLLNKGSKG